MKNLIYPLAWDTSHFGVSCGRFTINENVLDKTILLEIEKNNFEFLTIDNVHDKSNVNYLLGTKTSAFFVGMILLFTKKILPYKDKIINYSDIEWFNLNNVDIMNDIQHITRESFFYSRFFNDPNLTNDLTKQIYFEWIKNSINIENEFLIVAKNEKQVEGFALYSFRDNIAVIELIGVDNRFQGKGCGCRMFSAIEAHCIREEIDILQVGTQQNNIKGINFYYSMGCLLQSVTSMYHLWN